MSDAEGEVRDTAPWPPSTGCWLPAAPRCHGPLSHYWKAFVAAGFTVEAFEEPRIAEEDHALVESERTSRKLATRPYSAAFHLRKRARESRSVGPTPGGRP